MYNKSFCAVDGKLTVVDQNNVSKPEHKRRKLAIVSKKETLIINGVFGDQQFCFFFFVKTGGSP